MRVRAAACSLMAACSVAVFGAERPPRIGAVDIQIEAPPRVDDSWVRSRLSVQAGSPLDPAAVNADVRRLLESRLFADVTVRVEPLEDGVRLVYVVRRRWTLAEPVRVEGARRLSEKKVREAFGLQPDTPFDETVLCARAESVRQAYREARRPEATVTWRVEELDPEGGLARVVLLVQEGPRCRLKGLTFTGNRHVPIRDLEKGMGQRSPWNPLRWIVPQRYDEEKLQEGREAVLALYRNRGFLDVEVSEPEVAIGPRGQRWVTFDVHEGPAYRVGTVMLRGVTLFPEAEIRRLIRVRSGEPASAELFRASETAIEDFYGSRGYVDTRVGTTLEPFPDEGCVNLIFTVTEGTLTTIGGILIRGNTRTKDKVIRRELLVYPGDVLDEVRARRSERRVANLGFFDSVRRRTVETDDPHCRDLVFEVEEKRTGQLMLGAGFSSIDRIMGYTELSQGNFNLLGPPFTGGGQKLRLRAQFGSRRKDYELSFVEPWFLDRQLSLGVDMYRNESDYDDYDVRRTGVGVTLGRPLFGPNRVELRYGLERSQVDEPDDTNVYYYADATLDPYRFVRHEDRLDSSLTLTIIHDTRDTAFFPTRGNRTSLFGTLTGGPLGGDTDLYRLGCRWSQYLPLWFRHVLSLKARYEVVDAYGDLEDVPLAERLFVGGGRTIRGFDYRDVGPKVTPTPGAQTGPYRPVGGQSLAVANVEYTVPLGTKIRLAAFYDVGNVWREPYEWDRHNLAAGAGIGLRFNIPGFPIRIDRAWVVRRDHPLTDVDEWVVWIGLD